MKRMRTTSCRLLLLAVAAGVGLRVSASDAVLPIVEGPELDVSIRLESRAAVRRGGEFLLESQADDGSWHRSAALTALSLAALARTSEADSGESRSAIAAALRFLDSHTEPEADQKTEGEADDAPLPKAAAENGLSKQAETVLQIMAAVGAERHPGLPELSARATEAGRPSSDLVGAVVTAVRARECLDAGADSERVVAAALAWASEYYTDGLARQLDGDRAKSFVYFLGRALNAVREARIAEPARGNWRRATAVALLNRQRAGGSWSNDPNASGPRRTAATAFALLLFGQILP